MSDKDDYERTVYQLIGLRRSVTSTRKKRYLTFRIKQLRDKLEHGICHICGSIIYDEYEPGPGYQIGCNCVENKAR